MLNNWVLETTKQSTTASIFLETEVKGYVAFSSVYKDGDDVFYTIEDGFNKETGVGTYTAINNSITRQHIFEILKDGTLTKYNKKLNIIPIPINVEAGSRVFVGGSVQALTHNTMVNKNIPAQVNYLVTASDHTNSFRAPEYKEFYAGVDGYHFPANTEAEVGFHFQVPLDIAPDTDMYIEVHWATTDNTDGVVRWVANYTSAPLTGAFVDGGSVVLEQDTSLLQHAHLAVQHKLEGLTADTVIMGRMKRDSTNIVDTYEGEAVLLGVTVGYLSDRIGTPGKGLTRYTWGG